jgi:HTH-type transcriptional regulator / antitoxin HigA
MSTIKARRINKKVYGQLLTEKLPAIISTEAEHIRMLKEIGQLLKKDKLTPEEGRLFELMVKLVSDYENEHFDIPDASPREILAHLMEEHGLNQVDLVEIFGSKGITSEVLNGKRVISKAHAKKLAEYFHVSPELFI